MVKSNNDYYEDLGMLTALSVLYWLGSGSKSVKNHSDVFGCGTKVNE